jgi:hypothetical protein
MIPAVLLIAPLFGATVVFLRPQDSTCSSSSVGDIMPIAKKKPAKKAAKKLPVYDIGKDKPSWYAAPVCGYLAKVTVSEQDCIDFKYPFHEGDRVLVFGDIAKMSGHCVIALKNGKVHFGYHTDNFTPLTDEEI